MKVGGMNLWAKRDLGLTRRAGQTTPIHAVAPRQYAGWLKKQPALVKEWLKAQAFDPAPGRYCLLPGGKGAAGVLAIVAATPSRYDLAALPNALPAQKTYRLVSDLQAKDLEKLTLGWALGAYKFTHYRRSANKPAQLLIPKDVDASRLEAMASAIFTARDLINLPANDCGPETLAEAAAELARTHKASLNVTRGDALLKANYPLIHAVGRGSSRPPLLIDLRHGNPAHPKVTLVGKGVCFDTGGYDLKPSDAMLLMKKDMAGGAVMLALAAAVMRLRLKIRLRLLVPAVENMVSGDAFRPMDVFKSRKGSTVEIGNTDAEGRLILADALFEAAQEKPDLILDAATLTGAARVALGYEMPALFTNDDALAAALQTKAEAAEDPLWRLPLWPEYRDRLKSNIADLNSAPAGGQAGAIIAALFLEHFVTPQISWAHIDMMAWNTRPRPGRPEGGEAMGFHALLAYLQERYGAEKTA